MIKRRLVIGWSIYFVACVALLTACHTLNVKKSEKSSKAKSIFDGKTLEGWTQMPPDSWEIKNGAMASKGVGRGVIYTNNDYEHYRATFKMRHVGLLPEDQRKGKGGDHRACVLVFCTRPVEGVKGDSALNGVQFQPPNGGSWDYRMGKNSGGKGLFNRVFDSKGFKAKEGKDRFDEHEWHRVELLVDARTGKARMAVAQPVGTKAIEVLQFDDPTAAKVGPLAFQMHNANLLDEFKDIEIEVDPAVDELITTK